MKITPTLQWDCDRCHSPIADGDGYLHVDTDKATSYQQRVAATRSPDGETSEHPLDLPAVWTWVHDDCDPGLAHSYRIVVERFRTFSQILDWTGHLMAKAWVVDGTDWAELLQAWAGDS